MARPLTRLAIGLVLIALFGRAPLAQSDRVDDFISAEMKRQNIPGLSLVVIRDGKTLKAAGYGLADRAKKIPVTTETVFKIGSVSKQFLAGAIMLLEKDGKLRLDDPVGKHISDAPSSWSGITIRHLLTHTAGLVREAPGFDPMKRQPDADVIRSAYSRALIFAPGDKWEYSNVGYYVLAEIISSLSRRSWSDFIAERIFKPAGMSATRTTTTEAFPNKARGYSGNERLADAPDWPALRPSGAFISTALDLAKWEAAMVSHTILDESTLKRMWTRAPLNNGATADYGFGWRVGELNDRRTVHHGGGLPGFVSNYQRVIDDRLAVIVLTNTDDADVQGIARSLAAMYLPSTQKH